MNDTKLMDKEIIPVVVAVFKKGNKLLMKPKTETHDEEGIPRNPEMAGLWEFPGGMMKQGESPWRTLRREIWEELQIVLEPNPELFFARSALYDHHYLVLYYLCKTKETVLDAKVRWFRPQEIVKMENSLLPGTLEAVWALSMKGIFILF